MAFFVLLIGGIVYIAPSIKIPHRLAPATTPKPNIDTSTWKTYRNEQYGFEIKHPTMWGVSDYSSNYYVDVYFRNPAYFYQQVEIRDEYNPQRLSLSDWIQTQEWDDPRPIDTVFETSTTTNGLVMSRSKNIMLPVTSIPIDTVDKKYYYYIFERGGRIFTITNGSLVQLQLGDVPEDIFNTMVNSFNIIGSDTSSWKTYRNEQHGFEFRYPTDWSVEADTFKNIKGQVVISISSANSANIGISYCGAQSISKIPDKRCEFLSVGGGGIEIDWGFNNTVVASFDVSTSAYFLTFYKDFVKKEIIQQILSTFKFTSPEPSSLIPCTAQKECPAGFQCYNSQYAGIGPNGIVYGEQEGDLLCHQSCTTDADCTTGVCSEKEIFQGDVRSTIRFCE